MDGAGNMIYQHLVKMMSVYILLALMVFSIALIIKHAYRGIGVKLDSMTYPIKDVSLDTKHTRKSLTPLDKLRSIYYKVFYRDFKSVKDTDKEKFIWNLDFDGFINFIMKDTRNLAGIFSSRNIDKDRIETYLKFIDSLKNNSLRYYVVSATPQVVLQIMSVIITFNKHRASSNLKELASTAVRMAVYKNYDEQFYQVYGSKEIISPLKVQTAKEALDRVLRVYLSVSRDSGLELSKITAIVTLNFTLVRDEDTGKIELDPETELCYISFSDIEKFCSTVQLDSYTVGLLSELC